MGTILGFMLGVISLLRGLMQRLRIHFHGVTVGLIGVQKNTFVMKKAWEAIHFQVEDLI